MKGIVFVVLMLLSSFSAPMQEMRTIEAQRYVISYPENWQLDRSDKLTEFYLFSRLDGANDTFNENMNLISQNLVGMNLNLDQYTQISVNQIQKFFKDKIEKVEKRKNPQGQEYYEVIYSGKQEDKELKFLQYNYMKDGWVYVLTFTSEASQFEHYKDEVYSTFNSFRLK